ncbi:tyrosine-type recombinase/integrase, partial [Aureimonas psammosilenae]|uniref:tyrosine-type recombinase/integrase n=1 Tax=Aureimonas psammosilenae TaxID=2495496 RepID=UPI00126109D3
MRSSSKLSALAVSKMTKPGVYADGNGLYLQVAAGGSKSWLFRFMRDGKARKMGLGPVHTVTLAMARDKALECRRTLMAGSDPIDTRQAADQERRLAELKGMTFKTAAEKYIAANKAGWKNAKHSAQWTATLDTYVFPICGDLDVAAVDVGLVLKVLEPIWTAKPETASRVRGRIESVLDWATVRRHRHGQNPARWKGHLDHLLPARNKVAKVKHHAALPYADLGAFVAELRQAEGVGARALEFAILTAGRTGEVVG